MDIYTASEISYKNGYEAGVKEFAKELYNQVIEYETYDSHYTYEILDRIENLEEYLVGKLTKNDAEG